MISSLQVPHAMIVGFVRSQALRGWRSMMTQLLNLMTDVYIGMKSGRRLEEAAESLLEKGGAKHCKHPKRLEQRVREILKKSPSMRCDARLRQSSTRKRVARYDHSPR
jgi:hypothetical protein